MDKKEIIERSRHSDVRIFHEIQNARKNDKSFTEKGLFGMTPKFSQHEVRDIYFDAMGLGIMRGIEIGSINGQQIDLYNSTNDKQREFLDKFYKLVEEYNCAILYHPNNGMQVIDLNNR